MKKFLFNLILLFAIIVIVYLVISYIVNQNPKHINDYMSAIKDKHKRIQEINKPKIILAGGSNLAFGIDSELIEDRFSVPVVNLGLHAGLGLDFIINELKKSINERDVVILSIEYFLGNGDYDLQNYVRELYPDASEFYNRNILKDIQIHIDDTRKKLKTINQPILIDTSFLVYSRKSFNKHGDVIAHLDQVPPKGLADRLVFKYQYWEGIEALNEFYEFAKVKKVDVFFAFPNYPNRNMKKTKLL